MATDTYYTPEASRWKWEFFYDGQSRMRIRKDYVWMGSGWYPNGETRYLYDGMLVLQERSSANSPTVTYTRGRDLSGSLEGAGGIGGLLARSHGYSAGTWSTHNFYHADGNGNVGALVNGAGALQASYKYDPYGRYLGGSGTVAAANQMRWSSKLWVGFGGSATDGLYYYGYRFYDPYLQRWPNRDPIGEKAGCNLYGFVRNDAANLYDPHGLEEKGAKGEPSEPEPAKRTVSPEADEFGKCFRQWCKDKIGTPRTGPTLGSAFGTAIGRFVDTIARSADTGPGLTAIAEMQKWCGACQHCMSQFYNDDPDGCTSQLTCDFICDGCQIMRERIGRVAPILHK